VTNIGVCQLHILPCDSILCVCLGDCGLPLALFQVDFRVLVFSPHHVNQGGVQKTTPQVTLYKPDNVSARSATSLTPTSFVYICTTCDSYQLSIQLQTLGYQLLVDKKLVILTVG
jgi:hypothetical protein